MNQGEPDSNIHIDVKTEDDILHIRTLPDFNKAINQSDSELLLSYLTAPYLRVPLVLTFFATEDRVHSLRSKDLQDLLDAVLFEPGAYLASDQFEVPEEVPTPRPELLSTAYGLLHNELHRSPATVIQSIVQLLKLALDLDAGTFKSTTLEVGTFYIPGGRAEMSAVINRYSCTRIRIH